MFGYRLKKSDTSMSLVDKMWDDVKNGLEEKHRNQSMYGWCKHLASRDTSKYVIPLAIKRFVFEYGMLNKKPVRTMMLAFPENPIDLVSGYVCKKHRFFLTTSNMADSNTPDDFTVICPICNRDIFVNNDAFNKYLSQGKVFDNDDKSWKTFIEFSKISIRRLKLSNLKYRLTHPYYLKHRILGKFVSTHQPAQAGES